MRVAVITNNTDVINYLRDNKNDIDFFVGPYDYIAAAKNFDVILIDDSFSVSVFINYVGNIDVCVLRDPKNELQFDSSKVSSLINITNFVEIDEALKYYETKNRLNKYATEEKNTLEMLSMYLNNGGKVDFKSEIRDGLAIIGITSPGIESNPAMIDLLNSSKYNAIVYFDTEEIFSVYLRTLITMWNNAKKHNGEVVFWDKNKGAHHLEMIKMCNLDKMMKIFDTAEDALAYLKIK